MKDNGTNEGDHSNGSRGVGVEQPDGEILCEVTSSEYGNGQSIEDVFDRTTYPKPWELVDALVEIGLLTEKEATAFVYCDIELNPLYVYESLGFDSKAGLVEAIENSREKVSDAIWVQELIQNYRFPDFPEECEDCGDALGGMWVEPEENDERKVLCRHCGDVDEEFLEQL